MHGAVTVRYNNKLQEVATQKIRRHLLFLTFLARSPPENFTSVWNTIRQSVESLDDGNSITLGYIKKDDGYIYSTNNSRFPGTFEAVRFFAENHLHLPPVIGVRLGLGTGSMSPLEGYTGAVTLVWKPQWGYVQTVEQDPDPQRKVGAISFRKVYPQAWTSLRSLQLLFGDEEVVTIAQETAHEIVPVAAPRDEVGRQLSEDSPVQHRGALTPIAEGSNESSETDYESLDSYLLHDDPDLQEVLSQTKDHLDTILEEATDESPSAEIKNELQDRLPLTLLTNVDPFLDMASTMLGPDTEYREDLYDDEEVLCEIAIYPPMTNAVPGAPMVVPDEMLVFQTSA